MSWHSTTARSVPVAKDTPHALLVEKRSLVESDICDILMYPILGQRCARQGEQSQRTVAPAQARAGLRFSSARLR